MFLKSLFFLAIFIFVQTLSGQVVFSGVVKDSLDNPIAFVSVIASYTENEESIAAYTTSNNSGAFTLTLKEGFNEKNVWISYRHTSFATKKVSYSNVSQKVNVTLKEQKNILDEVILNAKKDIAINGDTITYNVAGLKKEKDYTIEEVLARIPGVTIEENGQIKYQDKAIKHLYINGVDLLEGRYNIATRGIPANAVEEVDIMQKHNHERVTIGKRDSDDVAFNLKIKPEHSLIFGSMRGDAGLPLLTAKVEATPIYIKDTFQDIASVKANNIGESLQYNGVSLTSGNYDLTSNLLNKIDILQEPSINGVSLSNKYWLDNESASITNDALLKSKGDLILKAGAHYNFNENELSNASQSVFYFGQDSTVVNRIARNRLTTQDYYAGVVQELNRDKLYFKNKLTVKGQQASGNSNLVQNENPLDYLYNNESINITNLTSLKFAVNEKLIDSGIYMEHTATSEQGLVTPVVFNDNIPGVSGASLTRQLLKALQFNVGGYAAYDFTLGKAKSQLKQTVSFRTESLETSLFQGVEQTPSTNSFPFISDFTLNSFTTQTSFSSTLKIKKFSFTFSPRLEFINLDKDESATIDLRQTKSYLYLQPVLGINYKHNYQWNASLYGSHTGSVSRFEQLFNALILTSPTGLFRNPDAINETRNLAISGTIAHTNILKGLILSNRTNYNRSESDFTISSSIDAAGQLQAEAIQLPNQSIQFSNTTSLNKRFFSILKTEWSYDYTLFLSEQIFNGSQQDARNARHSLAAELGIDNNTWYGITYKSQLNLGSSSAAGFKASNTFFKNDLTLDFYMSSKSRLNVGLESVSSSFSSSDVVNLNTLFNASFHYKPSKKLFLRASLNNIFNEGFFTTARNGANFISQSQFTLRPRQFTIGLNYSL